MNGQYGLLLGDFTGTNRVDGCWAAWQITTASLRSFLPLVLSGTTYLTAIMRASYPNLLSVLAQQCAPPHASSPIRMGGIFVIVVSSLE